MINLLHLLYCVSDVCRHALWKLWYNTVAIVYVTDSNSGLWFNSSEVYVMCINTVKTKHGAVSCPGRLWHLLPIRTDPDTYFNPQDSEWKES